MPEVAIVMSPVQPQPLPEFVAALSEELKRQGVPCTWNVSFPEPRRGLVYLFVSPRDYLRAHNIELPERAILRRTVVLSAEDPAALDEHHVDRLRDMGAVFDISQGAVVALHRMGVSARLLRPGYVASWDRFDAAAPRPIDILFYGARSDHREAALAAGTDVLARHICVVHLSDGEPHHGGSPNWLAEGRWPLLAQSKILVNLHRDGDVRLEWLRALDAMHTGAVLLTEHASGLAPFVPGEHLIVGAPGALPDIAEALLRDEPRLARIREAAHERLSSWLPFGASVAVLRAALLELVGRPVAAGMFLGSPREDPVRHATAVPDPLVTAVREELRTTRGELEKMRQEVTRLRDALELDDRGGLGQAPQIVRRTAAWSARRAPRISVLIAVEGDAEAAVATLESLAHSRERRFELILVVSPRGSAASGVGRWVRAHPRLAALVVTAPGRGRGEARDLAADFARAPACLVIDPGQRVYPRCLEALASALEGEPETAFVYPIRVDGDRLRNAEGFEAGRLKDDGGVVAPALIRTDVLREVGGCSDAAESVGGESDGLRRRLVAGGHTGRIVPQMLALAAS